MMVGIYGLTFLHPRRKIRGVVRLFGVRRPLEYPVMTADNMLPFVDREKKKQLFVQQIGKCAACVRLMLVRWLHDQALASCRSVTFFAMLPRFFEQQQQQLRTPPRKRKKKEIYYYLVCMNAGSTSECCLFRENVWSFTHLDAGGHLPVLGEHQRAQLRLEQATAAATVGGGKGALAILDVAVAVVAGSSPEHAADDPVEPAEAGERARSLPRVAGQGSLGRRDRRHEAVENQHGQGGGGLRARFRLRPRTRTPKAHKGNTTRRGAGLQQAIQAIFHFPLFFCEKQS